TEVAAIYPITPSSPMATKTDIWSANGRENAFGQPVKLIEMQSEAGAIGTVHGALQAGALTTTYTSSQGLMLMIPTLYRIAGEQLPAVLHVAARTVGTHAMSIFGDHSDVMAVRQTGVAMLSAGSVQEAADLAAIAHLSAVKGKIPFVHFFDGFRTSHELSRIDLPDVKKLSALLDQDALAAFRARALNPEHPMIRNQVQNGDVYFQMREVINPYYDALPGIVEGYLKELAGITGREYHIFDYYGAPDAERVIVAMGSVSGTVREVVDYLSAKGEKVGFVQVHLYRPFAKAAFLAALPESVQKIAVLDRCKEPGSAGEPLFEDVCTCMMGSGRQIALCGGRYGLSSKDVDPAQIAAVYDNLAKDAPKNGFTIGIVDDVTGLSLPVGAPIFTANPDTISCKFWGLGGDGTVGANHDTVRILGEYVNMYSQAYFEYDAKKSFGTTKSHLRFSKSPIRGSYYVKSANFVGCHNQNYIAQYDIVDEICPGGTLLLNCSWAEEELSEKLPANVKRQIVKKNIRLCTIDATKIAQETGLGSHTSTILQAAFFKLAGLMPVDKALELMKEAVKKKFFTKGNEVVEKNMAAIDAGAAGCHEIAVPRDWADLPEEPFVIDPTLPEAVKRFMIPINRQKGDDLPVSAFVGYEDGAMDMGLTAFEKRGIAVKVPRWNAEKCLQCNLCSLVCPHAAIRPYLLTEAEAKAAPAGFETVPAKGAKEYRYTLQISTYDCTGCGSCAVTCPAKEKALTMEPADLKKEQLELWNYGLGLSDKGDVFDPYTVKGSQFRQPLVEFSAACAGCGETPYAKLLTQLFGDRMYWANGTGCSQAWGSPAPVIPYTVNR
ncbi:MAG: pyruvate:ferredoxin (flavodoxin) oxidoreductase, partial [Clostridia bacterium]|nr:pyruvate:ferredoxin (flavodoxin) oxidoreductase [Clostridia bacterium]